MVILMPKDSAKIIHSLADHVKINEEGIDYLAEHVRNGISLKKRKRLTLRSFRFLMQ